MKKILTVFLCLCLLLPAAAACAERKVITALASEVNPEALVSVSVNARIRQYNPDSNTLDMEIIVPERYDPAEVRSLQIGDAIYTQGREVEIRTIENDESGYYVLNQDAEDAVDLYEGVDLAYWVSDVNDNTWTVLAEIRVPVPERLLFLDGIDPATGESPLQPAVHNAREFVSMLVSEEEGQTGPGFAINNVTAVFDETGALALVRRFYVPWQ